MYAIFFIFGSYIDFISRVKWIKARYKFENVGCGNSDVERKKHAILKMLNLAKEDG